MAFITSNFGTARGLIRLGLSYAEVALGAAGISRPDPAAVRRLVFVCHGNICRSAFADAVARQRGLRVASFGLSTDAGKTAYPSTITIAKQQGVDLTTHRTTRATDFLCDDGDYFLAMETRQLRALAADPRFAPVPCGLLGLYGSPPVPHLHDPYDLDPDYMPVCLARIERAVANLAAAFPYARLS